VLIDFVQHWCAETALPVAMAFPFEVALEEVCMNVIMHGTRDGGSPPEFSVSLSLDGNTVTMVIEDDGVAFDPLVVAAPDIDTPLEEREIGGLGVFLVRELMDDVSYAHTGTHNRLTMRKAVV
jgi:anti-sigma regulatory factor (Ser/Thr protein kinase)